jgi:hypothetical protein
MEPDTSVHTLSISSFSVSRANACRVRSGSDKKPTTPAADVRPTMVSTRVAAASLCSEMLTRWLMVLMEG